MVYLHCKFFPLLLLSLSDWQALLTGLAIHCPADSLEYVIDCLTCVQHFGYGVLQWDVFVPEDLRPVNKSSAVESALAHLFNFDDSQVRNSFNWLNKTPGILLCLMTRYHALLCSRLLKWPWRHLVTTTERPRNYVSSEYVLIFYCAARMVCYPQGCIFILRHQEM